MRSSHIYDELHNSIKENNPASMEKWSTALSESIMFSLRSIYNTKSQKKAATSSFEYIQLSINLIDDGLNQLKRNEDYQSLKSRANIKGAMKTLVANSFQILADMRKSNPSNFIESIPLSLNKMLTSHKEPEILKDKKTVAEMSGAPINLSPSKNKGFGR